MIAWLVDSLIQLAIVIPILIGAGTGDVSSMVEIVVIYAVIFLIVWGYYPLFEFFGQGRTPGKWAQRLRVVRTDGQPAGGAAMLVRTLIRIADKSVRHIRSPPTIVTCPPRVRRAAPRLQSGRPPSGALPDPGSGRRVRP